MNFILFRTAVLTSKSDKYFHKAMVRLERLEEIFIYDSVKKGVVRQGFIDERPQVYRDRPQMKRFSLTWQNGDGEWYISNSI